MAFVGPFSNENNLKILSFKIQILSKLPFKVKNLLYEIEKYSILRLIDYFPMSMQIKVNFDRSGLRRHITASNRPFNPGQRMIRWKCSVYYLSIVLRESVFDNFTTRKIRIRRVTRNTEMLELRNGLKMKIRASVMDQLHNTVHYSQP